MPRGMQPAADSLSRAASARGGFTAEAVGEGAEQVAALGLVARQALLARPQRAEDAQTVPDDGRLQVLPLPQLPEGSALEGVERAGAGLAQLVHARQVGREVDP